MQETAKQSYPGSVAFYDTWPGNEVGLFYNASELTLGIIFLYFTLSVQNKSQFKPIIN